MARLEESISHVYQWTPDVQHTKTICWQQENVCFDELIISWNANRPKSYLAIYVSLAMPHWTDPILYAIWEQDAQASFEQISSAGSWKIRQDIVECMPGMLSTGFRIIIQAEDDRDLMHVHRLFACVTTRSKLRLKIPSILHETIDLDVPQRSQFTIDHQDKHRICSPISVSSAVAYCLKKPLDTTYFLKGVWDKELNTYGNWPFATAAAFTYLGSSWKCYVKRMTDFQEVLDQLRRNIPLVVSIRGNLSSAQRPYPEGHLVVIRGFDATTQSILCMDPAFDSDQMTYVSYPLAEFIAAWRERGFISYVFEYNQQT